MSWLKLSAKQWRMLSKLNGNIDETVLISTAKVQEIFRSKFSHVKGKKPVVVVAPDTTFLCPDNGKVSDMHKNIPYCSTYMPAKYTDKWNCVWFAKESAVLMRGYAFGVMTVLDMADTPHRINVFINRKLEVWAWDPQLCNWPGSGKVKTIKVIHMGTGLENVGNHPMLKKDPFKDYEDLF